MALRQNSSSAILVHERLWPAPGDTGAHHVTGALDAAMKAPHIHILTVEAGAHDEIVGGLCAQKLAPKFAAKKAVIACHKITNVTSRPRHLMLFEVTDVWPASDGSDEAVEPVNLSELTDLGNAVQVETRYGHRIWPP
ncbi:MAG: hypothetical protein VX106_01025 [Pseudomonadota bacterium]|nr:hypothetical protein [Pseudomonadota bacterium]